MRAIACAGALLLGAFSPIAHAQPRSVSDRVFSPAQAARGQQTYQARCVTCHGAALEGAVGPPLTGDAFLSTRSARPLSELVDKIEKTMPPQAAGSLSRPQAIELAAFILQNGKFPAGASDLTAAALGQITFPAAPRGAVQAFGAVAMTPGGNLAQLMRAVTFPNANLLFNVQVKDPAAQKPVVPVPFDYVAWGATVYYGWQAVDQAAIALIETTPLFLLPGRRCENGRPVPVDRADFKQFTAALVDAGRAAYQASQTRNMDAVAQIAERLNDTCANCHKVYRDAAQEGSTAGANRCR